jgi:hypothetical protein
MLPTIQITFENGALGSVSPSADGVTGLVITASAEGNFALGEVYLLRRAEDLATLGATATTNSFLCRHVEEFYAEAGTGAELWLMGVANTVSQSASVNKANDYAKKLIQSANGRIRALGVAFHPASGYTPTITDGVDSDLWASLSKAQDLAKWATETLYAPLFVVVEGRHWSGSATALKDLSTFSYNRVGVMLGDTEAASGASSGAAIGLLLGRIARIPVQRHIGRVRDLALNTLTAFVGATLPENADVETIHDKGYITFRTFVGKSGYFFTDDSLATAVSDDYRSIARRRTVDKAYRIAYSTLIEFLNDEIAVTTSGELVPALVKSWESEVESAIVNQMTVEGNLSSDPDDPADRGVKCYIDSAQNTVATGKIEITLKVKPYGYAKYIDVQLGFLIENGDS